MEQVALQKWRAVEKETEEKKNHSKLRGDLLSLVLGKQRMNLLFSNFSLTTMATCYTYHPLQHFRFIRN